MKIKILLLLLVLSIFTACEREDIYDFMDGHTRPLMPSITIKKSTTALFNNDEFTITLKSRTGASIRYTIDGSTDPTPLVGIEYTTPFDISGTTEIRAIGYIDLEVSDISSTIVTVGDGSAGSPYEIASASQLNNIRAAPYLSSHFIQTANIDLSAYSSGEGWLPIGDSGTPFSGSYNGNGYRITGLKINRPGEDNVGLFGNISSASLTNIAMTGISIIADGNVGGLAGFVSAAITISNCYSTGSVKGNSITGGLVGNLINNSEISNSYSSCIVTGGSDSGGLAGRANNSTITRCYATGNVANTGNNTGGLVGAIDGPSSDINLSFAKGKVTGVMNTGGLIGYVFGSPINNCYATGEVIATGAGTGGLVGYLGNDVTANIDSCYSTGKVTGTSDIGGLLGKLDGSSIVSFSVWNETTSTQNISAGGSPEVTSTMKTQTHFESTLGWSFGTIWTIQEGVSYPYFQWQGTANIPH